MSRKLYKFLKGNKSDLGNHEWEIGKWYEVEGDLAMCGNGFHASEYIQDALKYVQGDTLAVVEVDGEHIQGEDKECWQRMKVVEIYDWTKIESLKLAIFSAELVKDEVSAEDYLEIIEDSIEISKKILVKLENEEDISAAEAAWAAEAAAWAAEAAWAAAEAAWAAGEAAAGRAAGEAAGRKEKINMYCVKIVKEVE